MRIGGDRALYQGLPAEAEQIPDDQQSVGQWIGLAVAVDIDGASNLDGLFNDRASSLRIERGYRIFCSDAGFRGEYRTFGPGEGATLPPELESRISSGRRISNDYPYNQNPSWQR